MKYAIVDGQRREAQPGLSGECPVCQAATIAKCGEIKIWHWAHKGKRNCDHWWENETPWHRDWKNHFPVEWQEVVCWADDGEKHIADVKTDQDCVIEFQHSYIKPDERRSREGFYKHLVWVVDGLRLETAVATFGEDLEKAPVAQEKPLMFSVPINKRPLLRDWAGCDGVVYFDFDDTRFLASSIEFPKPVLWRLDPKSPYGVALLSPVYRQDFISAMLKGIPVTGIDARHVMLPVRVHMLKGGFQKYAYRKHHRRRHSRL